MVNLETVATSMLTSGGILFAAYKIWFQRRLEDHKHSLHNNAKLFELELAALEEFSQLTQDILDSDFNVPLPEQEVFIVKSYDNEKELIAFIKSHSHIVSNNIKGKLTSLASLYRELQDETKGYLSRNQRYSGTPYTAYDNLPSSSFEKADLCRTKTLEAYEAFKSEVYERAGRKT